MPLTREATDNVALAYNAENEAGFIAHENSADMAVGEGVCDIG
jgi:hypothetical protein